MRRPRPQKSNEAGFTLLELLVAMTLLAMVFGLIAGGIGFGAAVWEKGGASAKRAGGLQTAHRVLRARIEAMRPLRRPREKRQALRPIAVDGEREALVFVAPPPAELAPPGLYRYRIAIEGSGRERMLTLSWRRLQPDLRDFDTDADTGGGGDADGKDADGKEKGTSGSVVLMDGIAGGRIDYFGAIRPKDPEEWQDRWENAPRLPALVRLTVDFEDADPREWPPLIVAPMVEGLR